MDARVGKAQFGFRKGWSALGNIFDILQLAEQARDLAEEALIVIFLDLKMCFARIRTEELRASLDRIGIRGKMLEMIMLFHQDLRCKVKSGARISKEYIRKRGLRPGDPAAGILCIIVLALVYRGSKKDVANHSDPEVRKQNEDNPCRVKEALRADDAAIPGLASKLVRVQAYIHVIISNLHRGGSEESRDKTSYIVLTGAAKHHENPVLDLSRYRRARKAAIGRV